MFNFKSKIRFQTPIYPYLFFIVVFLKKDRPNQKEIVNNILFYFLAVGPI